MAIVRRKVRTVNQESAKLTSVDGAAYLEFDGESKTIEGWAYSLGIKPVTILTRLLRGWSVRDTLTIAVYTSQPDVKRASSGRYLTRFLTYQGKTQHIRQWSEELGIPITTIVRRIEQLHWTPEKTLTTPPKYGFTTSHTKP